MRCPQRLHAIEDPLSGDSFASLIIVPSAPAVYVPAGSYPTTRVHVAVDIDDGVGD